VVTAGPARLVQGIDLARVEAAIRAAEQATSGEIRVAIARFFFWGDVRRAAENAFVRLRMDRTRRRNGVLIFVAPRRHQFAILGDAAIHERVTDAFWRDVAGGLGGDGRRGDLTGGLERAIATIGERLAAHFPPDPNDRNELPDAVAVGRRLRSRT
jgi:uncharacterized membrane protein